MKKMTLALFFANRGFFPGELIASAREELKISLKDSGFDYLLMDEKLTRYGAVETLKEGKLYAQFLADNRGKYDGVILCMPNFGDENGAIVALKDADVPILVQAYPDEKGKMDFAHRRDSMCGKLAMCNVLRQNNIKFTLTKRFTVSPLEKSFKEDLRLFGGICRAVKGLKESNIGVIGARTTAFKSVRFDEIAMANKHINVETIDLSNVFARMENVDKSKLSQKEEVYSGLACFGCYPAAKLENIARLGVVIDELIEEFNLQAVAVRCWEDLEKKYGVTPCLILGDLNERGIAAACEADVNNAVMMRALYLAADYPVMLLDVNNNDGDSDNSCILFHCGPAPKSLMREKGKIQEHLMFKKSFGEGTGVGINVGALAEGKVTLGSFKTENGGLYAFTTEGELMNGNIEEAFFGVKTLFKKDNIEKMLNYMANNGYRHHVAITKGSWAEAVREAFQNYLEYNIDII